MLIIHNKSRVLRVISLSRPGYTIPEFQDHLFNTKFDPGDQQHTFNPGPNEYL
jgi:hypothetical protein